MKCPCILFVPLSFSVLMLLVHSVSASPTGIPNTKHAEVENKGVKELKNHLYFMRKGLKESVCFNTGSSLSENASQWEQPHVLDKYFDDAEVDHVVALLHSWDSLSNKTIQMMQRACFLLEEARYVSLHRPIQFHVVHLGQPNGNSAKWGILWSPTIVYMSGKEKRVNEFRLGLKLAHFIRFLNGVSPGIPSLKSWIPLGSYDDTHSHDVNVHNTWIPFPLFDWIVDIPLRTDRGNSHLLFQERHGSDSDGIDIGVVRHDRDPPDSIISTLITEPLDSWQINLGENQYHQHHQYHMPISMLNSFPSACILWHCKGDFSLFWNRLTQHCDQNEPELLDNDNLPHYLSDLMTCELKAVSDCSSNLDEMTKLSWWGLAKDEIQSARNQFGMYWYEWTFPDVPKTVLSRNMIWVFADAKIRGPHSTLFKVPWNGTLLGEEVRSFIIDRDVHRKLWEKFGFDLESSYVVIFGQSMTSFESFSVANEDNTTHIRSTLESSMRKLRSDRNNFGQKVEALKLSKESIAAHHSRWKHSIVHKVNLTTWMEMIPLAPEGGHTFVLYDAPSCGLCMPYRTVFESAASSFLQDFESFMDIDVGQGSVHFFHINVDVSIFRHAMQHSESDSELYSNTVLRDHGIPLLQHHTLPLDEHSSGAYDGPVTLGNVEKWMRDQVRMHDGHVA